MTIDEMEKEQEKLHERFEQVKREIYDKWIEIDGLSKAYNKLEIEISKLKEAKNG